MEDGNGQRLATRYIYKMIYSLDINWLKERDKGVLLDINNTLITHKQKIPDDKVIELIKYFQKNGIQTAIIKYYKKNWMFLTRTDSMLGSYLNLISVVSKGYV